MLVIPRFIQSPFVCNAYIESAAEIKSNLLSTENEFLNVN